MLNRDLGRSALDAAGWDDEGCRLMASAAGPLALSARGWDRVRRVARTIADLDGSGCVAEWHVAEALSFRAAP
jgi:magnesium chelatase family protein